MLLRLCMMLSIRGLVNCIHAILISIQRLAQLSTRLPIHRPCGIMSLRRGHGGRGIGLRSVIDRRVGPLHGRGCCHRIGFLWRLISSWRQSKLLRSQLTSREVGSSTAMLAPWTLSWRVEILRFGRRLLRLELSLTVEERRLKIRLRRVDVW
jgi:hypothetical protein